MDITRWSILKLDWLYSLQLKMEKLYSQQNKTWNWLCSDQELLIAKLRLKLKKVGKTTRPFRYGLNPMPYDYTVEVMNRFRGLDLVNRVSEEVWTDVGNMHCTGGSDWNHAKEKEMQEGKVVVWGGFTNNWGKKKSKRQGRKGKIYPNESRVPENWQGKIRRLS